MKLLLCTCGLLCSLGLTLSACGTQVCPPETTPDPAGNCPIVEETASPSPSPEPA